MHIKVFRCPAECTLGDGASPKASCRRASAAPCTGCRSRIALRCRPQQLRRTPATGRGLPDAVRRMPYAADVVGHCVRCRTRGAADTVGLGALRTPSGTAGTAGAVCRAREQRGTGRGNAADAVGHRGRCRAQGATGWRLKRAPMGCAQFRDRKDGQMYIHVPGLYIGPVVREVKYTLHVLMFTALSDNSPREGTADGPRKGHVPVQVRLDRPAETPHGGRASMRHFAT